MSRLELTGIVKGFGGKLALDRVDLTAVSGTVHAILGENGAGKSTLMNVLSGLYRPDAGTIALDGRVVAIRSPRDALAQGIGMIHQHLTLVDALSGVENIVLGTGRARLSLALGPATARLSQLAAELGFEVDLALPVWRMPMGMRQRVEILKVLDRDARIVILDEPTSILTPDEATRLLAALRRLAAQGRTVLLITHKLQEVLDVADEVTVLRAGRVVARRPAAGASAAELARAMIGTAIDLPAAAAASAFGPTVLAIEGLSVAGDRGQAALSDVTLSVRAGEILGVAGVDGNGQAELAEAIAGLRPAAAGRIAIDGTDVTHLGVHDRLRRFRIGYVPADRQAVGLVLDSDAAANLILRDYDRPPVRGRLGAIARGAVAERTRRLLADFAIRGGDPRRSVRDLSGGNQQKLVLAREIDLAPRLLVAEQPCKGLDVAATAFVQERLLALRAAGTAILYISTELDEILGLADRIAVLHAGRLAGLLDRAEAGREHVGHLMAGMIGTAA